MVLRRQYAFSFALTFHTSQQAISGFDHHGACILPVFPSSKLVRTMFFNAKKYSPLSTGDSFSDDLSEDGQRRSLNAEKQVSMVSNARVRCTSSLTFHLSVFFFAISGLFLTGTIVASRKPNTSHCVEELSMYCECSFSPVHHISGQGGYHLG